MLDCSEMTYQQMADLVRSVRNEVKRRNPILVNVYVQTFNDPIDALEEISAGEVGNRTSGSGPMEVR